MDYQSICALRLPVCAVMFQKSMEFSVVTSETGPRQKKLKRHRAFLVEALRGNRFRGRQAYGQTGMQSDELIKQVLFLINAP